MRPAKAITVAAAALAALLLASSGVHATVETTCRAAADRDRRVDYGFCASELGKHRDSPGADTRGLAKVAANLGVNNAGGAVREVDALLAGPPGAAAARAALRLCRALYFDAELEFAGAYDEINGRDDSAAARRMAVEGASLARRCDEVFAEAGLRSPLARRGEYSARIAIVCAAIIDLINIQ